MADSTVTLKNSNYICYAAYTKEGQFHKNEDSFSVYCDSHEAVDIKKKKKKKKKNKDTQKTCHINPSPFHGPLTHCFNNIVTFSVHETQKMVKHLCLETDVNSVRKRKSFKEKAAIGSTTLQKTKPESQADDQGVEVVFQCDPDQSPRSDVSCPPRALCAPFSKSVESLDGLENRDTSRGRSHKENMSRTLSSESSLRSAKLSPKALPSCRRVPISFFAVVCDGHEGSETAVFVSQHLHSVFMSEWEKEDTTKTGILSAVVGSFRRAFSVIESQFKTMVTHSESNGYSFITSIAGACVAAILVADDYVFCANLGAVLINFEVKETPLLKQYSNGEWLESSSKLINTPESQTFIIECDADVLLGDDPLGFQVVAQGEVDQKLLQTGYYTAQQMHQEHKDTPSQHRIQQETCQERAQDDQQSHQLEELQDKNLQYESPKEADSNHNKKDTEDPNMSSEKKSSFMPQAALFRCAMHDDEERDKAQYTEGSNLKTTNRTFENFLASTPSNVFKSQHPDEKNKKSVISDEHQHLRQEIFYFKRLSQPHRTTNNNEVMRIERLSGRITNGRIDGLEPTRRDFDVKESQPEGVLSTEPDVMYAKIERPGLVLLASDGVWDAVSSEQIVHIFKKNKRKWKVIQPWLFPFNNMRSEELENSLQDQLPPLHTLQDKVSDIARALVRETIKWSADDSTCVLAYVAPRDVVRKVMPEDALITNHPEL